MKVLVTGGSGFLGRHMVSALLSCKDITSVQTFSRRLPQDLEAKDVQCFQGDLADYTSVEKAVEGVETVFHIGAKAGIWGRAEDYYRANIIGTRNVLAASLKYGVRHLIYTSTPSVVFNGEHLCNVSERTPYGKKFLCPYAQTKAIAEQEVLRHNGRKGLKTIALRPHLIWGPGDNHLIPNLIAAAKKGRLKQVGTGENWVDISYIDNVVEAHLLALEALQRNAPVDGKAYFITQGDPVKLWDWINDLLKRLRLAPVRRKVPYGLAYAIGCAFEGIYKCLRIKKQPPMTRFLAVELSKDHYFDISAAKMDLKYVPKISNDEGLARLVDYLVAKDRS